MDSFVNRTREVDFFQRLLAEDRAQLVLLYGRRRVGKTSLLRHVASRSPIPVLYHVAAQTTRVEELERLSARLAEFFDDDLLKAQPLRTWESVWLYLSQKAAQKRFGLMLDEFPYAAEADSALPSLLQHAWDQRLRETGIKIVLCGSSISMMERIGLSSSSPLYGRRTGQWRLEPFGPDEFALLWPASAPAETLAAYCVTGGSPQYVGLFDPKRSLLENVRTRILSKGSMMYEEVPFLLREELRDPRVYQAILAAVAGGARKFSELSSKAGLDKAHLTRYVATLAELGFLEREVPVTEAQPAKSRRGLYRLADPFLAFWYRFVFPYRDRLEMGEVDSVMERDVAPAFDAYVARTVEPYVGALFRSRWRGRLPFEPAFMGRHWDDRVEIDWLIFDRDRKRAVAVEIKWSGKPVNAEAVASELKAKAGTVPVLRGCELTYAVVARSGFVRSVKDPGCLAISLTESGDHNTTQRRA